MDDKNHGITIGIERIDDKFYLRFKAAGMLTHQDYEEIAPLVEAALAGLTASKIQALVDVTNLDGWELRAAWDDFKLGLRHGNEFEKVAIYGNQDWQRIGANIASWFVAADIKFFDNAAQALEWMKS